MWEGRGDRGGGCGEGGERVKSSRGIGHEVAEEEVMVAEGKREGIKRLGEEEVEEME